MDIEEFNSKFCGVISVKKNYNPNGINEYCIEKNCRSLCFNIKFKNNVIVIKWITKDKYKKHNLLDEEFKRCFKHIGFNGILNIQLSYGKNIEAYTINCCKKKYIDTED